MEEILGRNRSALRYISTLLKIKNALYRIREGDAQTANEELLKALDDIITYREYVNNRIEELQKIQTCLKQVEENLVKSIETEDLEKKRERIEEAKRMYESSLSKIMKVAYSKNNGGRELESQYD
jgi:Rps23 Pro-64 3,4-dihydroxylase Tpa1-like proline 4-hydroxylase